MNDRTKSRSPIWKTMRANCEVWVHASLATSCSHINNIFSLSIFVFRDVCVCLFFSLASFSSLRFVVAVGDVLRSSRGFFKRSWTNRAICSGKNVNFCCLSHEMNHFDYYTSPRSPCVHKMVTTIFYAQSRFRCVLPFCKMMNKRWNLLKQWFVFFFSSKERSRFAILFLSLSPSPHSALISFQTNKHTKPTFKVMPLYSLGNAFAPNRDFVSKTNPKHEMLLLTSHQWKTLQLKCLL